jgi:hypothetical protein
VGRRGEHFAQFAFCELLLLAHDFGSDSLAIDGERNKDRFAFLARYAFAAKGNVFNLEFYRAHQPTIAQPFKAGKIVASNIESRQGRQTTPSVPNGTRRFRRSQETQR